MGKAFYFHWSYATVEEVRDARLKRRQPTERALARFRASGRHLRKSIRKQLPRIKRTSAKLGRAIAALSREADHGG